MALKRLRFLFVFIILCIVLSFLAIYSPLSTQFTSSAIHHHINKGLGFLPNTKTLKTLVPDRFKWSNWHTSDAVKLEESLIHHHPNSSMNSSSSSSASPPVQPPTKLDHHLDPDGLYYLQQPSSVPLPRHPILELIEQAEKAWQNKTSRSSKTLDECVREYQRRYNRAPPFGFEKWWEYAVANGVILKDEYDQIGRDLHPFLAIEPSDLLHRSWVMANERPETFTLSLAHNRVSISGAEGHLARAKDLAGLLNLFAPLLPLDHNHILNLTFTKHDQPAVQMSWARKQKMIEMADVGEYFSPSDYIRPTNPKLTNWANACPPSSALYKNETGVADERVVVGSKSFIYDHQQAMEVCKHPETMALHGFTAAAGTDNVELVPLFTFAKASTQSDVLVTPLEQYSDTYIGEEPAWDGKKKAKLLWRGSTTGAEFKTGVAWQNSQRARLHLLAHDTVGEVEVLTTRPDGTSIAVPRPRAQLNTALLDIAFSGGPVQCDPPTCAHMATHLRFANTMGLDESYQYKYLMDVDGNGWSGRFHRLMSTNSLVLKSTIFPEWYSDRIQPWVHYVPVKVDYSDLYDLMVFFQGDIDGSGGHDKLAEKIASAGKQWAKTHWRRVDMAAYMFRLLLEWRRIILRTLVSNLDFAVSA